MIISVRLTDIQLRAIIADAAGCSPNQVALTVSTTEVTEITATAETNHKGVQRLERTLEKHGVQS